LRHTKGSYSLLYISVYQPVFRTISTGILREIVEGYVQMFKHDEKFQMFLKISRQGLSGNWKRLAKSPWANNCFCVFRTVNVFTGTGYSGYEKLLGVPSWGGEKGWETQL